MSEKRGIKERPKLRDQCAVRLIKSDGTVEETVGGGTELNKMLAELGNEEGELLITLLKKLKALEGLGLDVKKLIDEV